MQLQELTGAPLIGPAAPDQKLLEQLAVQAMSFRLPSCPSFTPRYVHDGEQLELIEGLGCEVLFTPGHTPGGVCFYFAGQQLLLSGDTLFAGSVGRTDFPGGNAQDLLKSIKTRLYTLPPATRVLSGHGPDTTIAEEIEHNPFTSGRLQMF